MSDLLSQLDPMFVGIVLSPLVHQLVELTQDKHGKTKPFVIYVCLILGFLGGLVYFLVGQDTWDAAVDAFVKIAGFSLMGASTIWALFRKVPTRQPTPSKKKK